LSFFLFISAVWLSVIKKEMRRVLVHLQLRGFYFHSYLPLCILIDICTCIFQFSVLVLVFCRTIVHQFELPQFFGTLFEYLLAASSGGSS